MKKADFITGIILCFLSLFFILTAFKMPIDPAYGVYAYPGITPIFLATVLFILSLYLVIRSRIKLSDFKEDIKLIKNFFINKENQNLLITAFFILMFTFLLKKIPFYILTFLFIFSFSLFFYRKKIILLLVVSIISTFVIITLFSKVFLIPMP
ncbi:MAG: tripartite tricarboxylate transporter TctB family protein [Dictyoglomaceae bacterium]